MRRKGFCGGSRGTPGGEHCTKAGGGRYARTARRVFRDDKLGCVEVCKFYKFSRVGRFRVGEGFRIEQIDHVEVFVPDRHEAAGWYGRVFGLEVTDGFEEWAAMDGGPLMLSCGNGTKLALFEGKPGGDPDPAGFRRVAFRVGGEGFIEFLGRLEGLGIVARTTDHDKAYSVYFADPYGNDFEVTTYERDFVSERI